MKLKLKHSVIFVCCICLFAVSALLLTSLFSKQPVAQAEEIAETPVTPSGVCGTDAIWEYSEDTKTLTISGSGAMTSYAYGTAPWYSYAGKINKVIVSDEITSISAGAFYGFNALREITLPFVGGSRAVSEQVERSNNSWRGGSVYLFGYIFGGETRYEYEPASTEDWIYQGQSKYSSSYYYYDGYYIPTSLRKVTITDAEGISANAFYGCTMIEELNLNDSITAIYDKAFYNCTALDVFKLPNDLATLGSSVLLNCDALTDIEIPTGITVIPTDAFFSCDGLTNVKFHPNITAINPNAFIGCRSLKNVTLPESLETIGDSAFKDNIGLTEIIIPDSVTSIGSSAFSGCVNVTSLTIGNSVQKIDTMAFNELDLLTKIVVPESVTTLGAGVFQGCNKLQEITLPFVGGSRAVSEQVERSNNSWRGGSVYLFGYIFGGETRYEYEPASTEDWIYQGQSKYSSSYYYYDGYYIPTSLRKVTITDAEGISANAFYGCTMIEELNLNDSITAIYDNAFYNLGMINQSSESFVVSGDILLKYKGSDTNVTIPDGIELIAPRAFESNSTLSSVQFPNTVTWVGDYAFYNCTNAIVNVPKISGSLTLGSNAFTNTGSVKYLDQSSYSNGNDTYYYTIDTDGNAIIVGCTTTSVNITLPVTLGGYPVIAVGYRGMADCTTLTSVTIPNNIVRLDLYAFAGCTGITTATIPATCQYVGDYAFTDCTSLATVVIAEGVTYLGDYCFRDCTSLTEIVVPDSCEYLGKYAFYNCTALESATIGITVPAIYEYTFYNCENLATVVIGISVEQIGNYAFYNTALTRVTTPYTLRFVGDYAFAESELIERVTLCSGFLSIGDGAFMNDAALTTINFPSTMTDIGAYAFYGCSSLASVTIPELVERIEDYTFAYCTNLSQANVNGTITYIGDSAFYRDALTAFTFTEGLTEIGRDAFAYNALTAIELPDTLETLGEQAFNECSVLQTVSMPDSVTYVGAYAFSANAADLTITVRYNTGKIADYMLFNTDMYAVIMEDGITEIGDYAFALNRELANITFPSTLQTIGEYAFYDNRAYSELTLPNAVISIGEYAFARGYSFVKISIPDSIQTIGEYAFYREEAANHIDPEFTVEFYYNKGVICDNILDGQHIQHIIVADNIYQVGNNAFSNCANLLDISLPDTISSFGIDCFINDNAVTMYIRPVDGYIDDAVYQEKLNGVTDIFIDNTEIGNYAFYGNVWLQTAEVNGESNIGDYAFYNCNSMTMFAINGTIEHIGEHAFHSCMALQSMSLPATVNYIGSYAFYDCNSMESINIPNGVEKVLSHTFYGCASLGNIVTPDSVTAIEDYAFYGCVAATTITLSQNCASIGEAAFYNCKALTELTIPDSVKQIGEYAFRSCVEIKELDFSDNVEEIGACAFYDCNALETVRLGKKIVELKDRLFYGCVNLTSLYVNAPLSYIDMLAFYGAEDVTVYCGRDDYMINYFDENGIAYVIDEELVYEYKIAFEDYDGKIISSATYTYGSTVVIPDDPIREADNTYTYEFAGWDKEVVTVGGNAVYTATYTPTYIEYTIIFQNYDGTELSKATYHYGDEVTVPETPSRPADNTYTYEFAGWDNEVVACAGDATYTATYNPVYIEYTVIFKNYDGSELSKATYHYGDEVVAPENPAKPADNMYTYEFAGWDKEVVACEGDATYTATYDPVYIEYTIIFKNYDGTELSNTTYHYGDEVMAPETPSKPADNTYTYEFAGWDKEVVACAGDATYTATYEPVYIEYTVIFKNYDGTELSKVTYHYGDDVEAPETPSKPADNTYIYEFVGWDKDVVACVGDATYTATYNSVYIEYTIVFENIDGTEISKKTYHYGDEITVPEDPSKEADLVGTYTFTGWDSEITVCEGNKVYTATYDIVYIDYTVVFKNYDGEEISRETYHYGDTIELPETPVKPADNTYTYEFAGWGAMVDVCEGNAEYTAEFTPVYIEYMVIFKNYDGAELSKATYHYGDKVTAPGTPSKPADNTYTYEFAGWDNEVVACAGDATYTATYNPVYIEYTVIFKNYDGSELSKATYHYGDEVVAPENPAKPADNMYTYEFAGWDKEVVACEGDATYTATYDPVYIEYTIIFKNYDGTELSNTTYHYGDEVMAPETPSKPADNTYTYEFAGWDKEVVACAGDATYTATYEPVYIEYTVIFKNYDGTELSKVTYHYGDDVEAPETPSKPADNTYTYEFAGWDNEVVACVGDATYTAMYDPVYIEYTVKFLDWNGSMLQERTYHYGDTITSVADPARENDETYIYSFKGWNKEVGTCTGNMTFTAQYETTYIEYTVVFKNYDGTVLSRKTYHYGDALELPAEPSRSADETYIYRFKEWENLSPTCTGDAEYMAVFEEIYIEYTIVFEDYNGTILSEKTYRYGEAIEVPSNPVREADESFRYEFAGWDKEVIECAGDATYTATYRSVPVESSQNGDEGGLPGGAIAGIAAGSVAVVGGGGFAAYWFFFRKRRKL